MHIFPLKYSYLCIQINLKHKRLNTINGKNMEMVWQE